MHDNTLCTSAYMKAYCLYTCLDICIYTLFWGSVRFVSFFINRVVEWLDEYHPGSFRQAQVSFSTRIPNAFPLGDAMTMSTNVCLYNAYGCHLNYRDVLKPPATNKGPVNGPLNDAEPSTPLPSVIEEESELNLNVPASETVQQAPGAKVLSPKHGGMFQLNTFETWHLRKVCRVNVLVLFPSVMMLERGE